MLTIHADSHLDHGLTEAHIAFIVERFADKSEFFIETFDLPETLSPLKSALYGPLAGDAAVVESDVRYAKRGERDGETRLVDLPQRETRTMTVIAGPHGGEPCILFTSYGGPCAPREPFDPSLAGDEKALAESKAFWAEHALAAE
jgi:hypothetical protein